MRARDAKKLHNRDEVEVRVGRGDWCRGYVLGDPRVVEKTEHFQGGVFVTVQADGAGYIEAVRHTDLR